MDAARPAQRHRRSRARKLLGQIGLSVALLLVAELVTRGLLPSSPSGADPYVGFAGDSALFVLDAQNAEFVTNPERSENFNSQRFAARKPSGTVRIACVGGSTTYGRPYRDATSFPGWLRAALPLADPSQHYEVINAGGVSYASYRVARVVDELLQHDLDLLVIYTGHNEFLEERTFGDALKQPSALRRLAALLERSALFRAARELAGVAPAIQPPSTILSSEVTAVLDSAVGLHAYTRDDALAADILEHFSASLARMLAAAHAADTPVLLVAPASQLVGCAPFKSAPDEGLSATQLEEFNAQLAFAADTTQSFNARRQAALRASLLSPRHALAAHLDGELALRVGDHEHAARALRRARDQDLVPLRAPTRFVNHVRDVAQDNQVWFLDAERLLAKRAEQLTGTGLPGPESFLDHVHMTPEAYAELAFAMLDVLAQAHWLKLAPEFDTNARAELVQTRLDALDTEDHVRALERLAAVLDWAGKRDEAERLAQQAQALGGGVSAFSHWQQGHFARQRGELQAAAEAYAQALELDPNYTEALLNRGEVMLRLERPTVALEHFDAALQLDATLLAAQFGRGVALGLMNQREAEQRAYQSVLAIDSAHADAWNRLALSFAAEQRNAKALDTLERARLAVPQDASLAFNHGALLERADQLQAAREAYRSALTYDPDYAAAATRLEQLGAAGAESP